MADDRDTLAILAEEIGSTLQPLNAAFSSPGALRDFLGELGWDFAAAPNALNSLKQAVESVVTLVQNGPISPDQVAILLDQLRAVFEAIRNLKNASGLANDFKSEFPGQLLQYLLAEYFLNGQPSWGFLLMTLGVIRLEEVQAASGRLAHVKRVFDFDPGQLFSDPLTFIKNRYHWGQSIFAGELLLTNLDSLLAAWEFEVWVDSLNANTLGGLNKGALQPQDTYDTALRLVFIEDSAAAASFGAGVRAFLLPETASAKPGLAILPFATQTFEESIAITEELDLDFQGGIDLTGGVGILIRPDRDIEFLVGFESGTPSAATGTLAIKLNLVRPGSPFMVFGSPNGSRFEVAGVSTTAGTRFRSDRTLDVFIEFAVEQGKIVVKPDPDQSGGLIAQLLPRNGLQIKFDLTIGFSTSKGLYFGGGGGLETNRPVYLKLGPVSVTSVYAAIKALNSEVRTVLATTLESKLGPIEATIDRIGLKCNVSFPDDGGNLGPVNLDFGFKPPSGIGLVIDGGGFKGGGFLSYDSGPPEIYSGALLLKAQKISISAFGVFEKSASGVTSFAFILGVRFNPGIELGFGFSLTGVGGVVGINRHIDVDAMRERFTSGTAGDLFFTDDPVKNAPRLLGDMQSLMPAAEGIYTFGPTLRITWLKKAIFDIAILIELPGPSKVVLVGVARLTIGGDEEKKIKPVLKLRIDVLGVIDFTKKHIQFDATIVDSTLMQIFKLSGDAALQMDAGEKPYVMLAIGGFHPAFKPEPAVFRKLKRITGVYEPAEASPLALSMAGYLAVTTNTFQLGAQITATLKAGSSVTIEGQIGFDALIQFQPFHFVIDFSAKVRVKVKGHNVAGVTFKGTISGPGPVIIYGKFCIEILFFDFCFSHSFQIGDSGGELPAVVANLLEALRAEVTLANLEAAEIDDLLSINKDRATTDNPLFPAGQVMTFSQKKAPLGLPLSRFDGVPLSKQQAAVISVDPSISATLSPVEDWFSPGSFANLTQSQALNMPAFQRLSSGTTLDLGMSGDVRATHEFKYDVRFIPETPAADDPGLKLNLSHPESLLDAISGRAAAPRVFAASPIIGVTDEQWEIRSGGGTVKANRLNEAEAHQRALMIGAVALPAGDVITLNGV